MSRPRLFSTSCSVCLPHVRTYVPTHTHTYVRSTYNTRAPTFNDRYAFNCSPSPRGRARLTSLTSERASERVERASERTNEPAGAACFMRRYFPPRRVIGVRDIEDRPTESERQREGERKLQRNAPRLAAAATIVDTATSRCAAPRRRSAGVAPSLSRRGTATGVHASVELFSPLLSSSFLSSSLRRAPCTREASPLMVRAYTDAR